MKPSGHSSKLHSLSRDQILSIRRLLLEWYDLNARVLPWRIPSVPFGSSSYEDYVHRLYKCLISETMLQQTQVKTVLAYYEKWLEKFPSIEKLAQAQEEEVMACWAGLGYYSRAKRLHQAAQYLVEKFVVKEDAFPTEPEHWIKHVPGVGPYTAGAVISIAFGDPSAIVDGNVQRVLSRVLAIHGDTSTPKSAGTRLVWARAAELVQGDRPGDFNQSLMELGATICSPTQPQCKSCPLSRVCVAHQQARTLRSVDQNAFFGKQAVDQDDIEDLCSICPSSINPGVYKENYIQSYYPFKPQKKAQREEDAIVLVITRGNEVYLEKKEKGLLAGLFDFPTTLIAGEVQSLVEEKVKQYSATSKGSTLHLFSHIRRTSHVLVVSDANAKALLEDLLKVNATGRFVDRSALSSVGVSELCLKNERAAFSTGKRKPPAVVKKAKKIKLPTPPASIMSEASDITEPVKNESVKNNSVKNDSVKNDSVKNELVKPESIKNELVKKRQSSIFTMFKK